MGRTKAKKKIPPMIEMREVLLMFTVYNELGFAIATTDDEANADFLAWLNNGYFI